MLKFLVLLYDFSKLFRNTIYIFHILENYGYIWMGLGVILLYFLKFLEGC